MRNKIILLNELKKKIIKLKKQKKKIVLCHGTFDILHLGHLRHFKKCKSLGDILIVNLTKDQFINKGPGRPIFKLQERLEALQAVSYIDYITFNNLSNALDVIEKVKPNYYCKGEDYLKKKNDLTKQIYLEKKAVEKNGGQLYITKEGKFSSSKISNLYNLSITKDQSKIITNIKARYSINDILKIFKKIENHKIIIIGETILDKYVFVEAIGKSGKDPILMFEEKNHELYLGGSAAIANHIANFSKHVNFFSFIGNKKRDEIRFIKSKLNKNIKLLSLVKKESSNLVKTKYVDQVSKSKIIGFYSFQKFVNNTKDEKKIKEFLNKSLTKYKQVLVADYGHGMISKESSKIISNKNNFTFLNVQINAGNIANHSIKKYKNINCVMINESELRHEMKDLFSDIKVLTKKISISQNFKYVCITRGTLGSLIFNKEKNTFFECSAFAGKIVDRVGAGDAMLAILSCVLTISKDEELSLFLGSLAAAQKVAYYGNSSYVSKDKMIKVLQHLFQ